MNTVNKNRLLQENLLDSDVVLKVENVSKKFCRSLKRSMFYGTLDTTRSMFRIPYSRSELRRDEFWALKDVSFELRKGEVLGIIGENGSGKSTLLRLLAGIFPPDMGRVILKGQVGALIAVGAGFHPHMTGRENIYLNGVILGMSKKEIDEKFEEIVEFSEIGDFLDAPVSTYSSGMKVKLGFSIAVHREPNILLVDEVLSVGDLSFRNKSMRKMAEFRQKANAMIFISHNLEIVRNICDRVLIIEKGSIVFSGNTDQGIVLYEELSRSKRIIHYKNTNTQLTISGEMVNELIITKFGIEKNDKLVNVVNLESELILVCQFENYREIEEEIVITFGILNEDKKPCIWLISNLKKNVIRIGSGIYEIRVILPRHNLMPGLYLLNFAIRNTNFETLTRFYSDYIFNILSDGNTFERGIVQVDDKWIIEKMK